MKLSYKKKYCLSCGRQLFFRRQQYCDNCNIESCREFTWFLFIDHEQYGKRKCLENPIPSDLKIGYRNQEKKNKEYIATCPECHNQSDIKSFLKCKKCGELTCSYCYNQSQKVCAQCEEY